MTADGDCSHEIKRCLLLGRKAMTNLDNILKSWNTALLTKVHLVKSVVFPVVVYGCESWTIKKLSAEELMLLNLVLEKILEVPWDWLGLIQPISPKGDQSWIFIVRTDAETPNLWPTDVKNWLIGKDPDAEKDWRHEEKGMTEDEVVRWHHQLNGHEFEQTPGVGDEQRGLACCSPWGHKESDTTDWTEQNVHRQTLSFYAILNSGYFELLWISQIKWCKTCTQFGVSMEKEVKVHLVETFSEILKKGIKTEGVYTGYIAFINYM